MDIVLFNPAPRSGWQAQRRVELPLSLLCPATPLDRQGYGIKIIDEVANPNWKKELRDAISKKPICFGVTSMTGPQILHALGACRLVKEVYPDVPVIWGGIHPSLLPEQTLANPLVDIMVVGEGEATFEELVKALETRTPLSRVKGICYQENGKVYRTETRAFVDLNEQPPLSYHLVNMDHYRRRLFGRDHISFNSSRGCTYRCSFCWDPVMHKRRWRAMEADTVLDHLNRIVKDYGLRGFLFTDDHFFIDMDRAYRILEAIVRVGLDISISKLQIRADTLCRMKKDFFELLVRAGVKRVSVGVESGSQAMLDLIKKDLSVEDVIEANRKLIPYPIVPVFLFMMGLPTETPEQFAKSIRLAIRLTDENPKAVKTFNIYTPYPGTKLYDRCIQLGLREPQHLEGWSHFNFRNVFDEAGWISPEMKRLMKGLDFPLMFLGKGHFVTPYKKTNPIVVGLSKLYYPVARYRVTHLEGRLPIETKLVKTLGLFGRQD
jgi:anaerobic magnesium-protoporphyrin IX monomethyl ester cyclase